MTTPKSTTESTTTAQPETENPKPKRRPTGGKGNQPKKQASKNRAVVKMRRKKIIKAMLEGKTHQEAGIIAGFKPENAGSQVQQTLGKPAMQSALQIAMEKAGVNDELISERLHTLIHGKKVISATVIQGPGSADLKDAGSMTKDFIEVDDNQAIAKGIEIACKIKGAFTEKHEVDIKQPVTIVIKKFCSRVQKPAENAPGGSPA
jgi:hypothetical protein